MPTGTFIPPGTLLSAALHDQGRPGVLTRYIPAVLNENNTQSFYGAFVPFLFLVGRAFAVVNERVRLLLTASLVSHSCHLTTGQPITSADGAKRKFYC